MRNIWNDKSIVNYDYDGDYAMGILKSYTHQIIHLKLMDVGQALGIALESPPGTLTSLIKIAGSDSSSSNSNPASFNMHPERHRRVAETRGSDTSGRSSD